MKNYQSQQQQNQSGKQMNKSNGKNSQTGDYQNCGKNN